LHRSYFYRIGDYPSLLFYFFSCCHRLLLLLCIYTVCIYGTYLVDALRPSSAPLTVLIWSHSTRQSFVESALASPPILRYYIYFPSSACIYPAGVSLPSRINRKRKSPISMESGGRFASVCQSKNQTLEN
jgi:hypothetical protein